MQALSLYHELLPGKLVLEGVTTRNIHKARTI